MGAALDPAVRRIPYEYWEVLALDRQKRGVNAGGVNTTGKLER